MIHVLPIAPPLCCCCDCVQIGTARPEPPPPETTTAPPPPPLPDPNTPVDVYYHPVGRLFFGGWGEYQSYEDAKRSIAQIRNYRISQNVGHLFHYTIWNKARTYKIEEA